VVALLDLVVAGVVVYVLALVVLTAVAKMVKEADEIGSTVNRDERRRREPDELYRRRQHRRR